MLEVCPSSTKEYNTWKPGPASAQTIEPTQGTHIRSCILVVYIRSLEIQKYPEKQYKFGFHDESTESDQSDVPFVFL